MYFIPSSALTLKMKNLPPKAKPQATQVTVHLDSIGRFVVTWLDCAGTERAHAFTDVEDANRLARKLREHSK